MINIILEYLRNYVLILGAMSLDNIFWIGTSPEYSKFKNLPLLIKSDKILVHENKLYYTKLGYIFKYRIWSVLKSWRDIVPALITAGILTWLI